ncbi:thiamine diphosphokinase [Salisediminibacterium beveridgei]|uniref:Thiamine diphosphokinase n=1 Tax=Salisediminibacterium beveridgei TaxID=632773 RepID=A0A1D7QW49_9BACI|nr:thiamine diphosphokinase [Salisediminibacterium beveridgei]AOM83232.1 Thiamin pyrophosphokinase [Salisediminibacterium beveridgei]
MSNHVVIWAGGPEALFPSEKILHQLKQDTDVWIGADMGAKHIIDRGISPCLAVGDFDSVDLDGRERIMKGSQAVAIHPVEKDETDLEIAIAEAMKRDAGRLTFLGVTGGRMDHQMMTMQLMEKVAHQGIAVELYEQSGRVWIWPPGYYQLQELESAYVSFLPVTERVEGLSLKGFKYDAHHISLLRASSLCVSNEQVKDVAEVTFHTGLLYGVTASD